MTEQLLDDPSLPQEFRKIMNIVRPENQNMKFVVDDARSSREKLGFDHIQIKYLRAKWDHYIDQKLSQLQITTKQLEHDLPFAELHDKQIEGRMEFMYNYMDFRSDRHRVRERFLKHVNKKSTIEDIGGLIDKFTLDSKANTEYFQPEHHLLEQPKVAMKDVTEGELFWQGGYLANSDPVRPQWLDDQTDFDKLTPT